MSSKVGGRLAEAANDPVNGASTMVPTLPGTNLAV